MSSMMELAIMMASSGMIAVLFAVYFNWRARLLSRIRGGHHARG